MKLSDCVQDKEKVGDQSPHEMSWNLVLTPGGLFIFKVVHLFFGVPFFQGPADKCDLCRSSGVD